MKIKLVGTISPKIEIEKIHEIEKKLNVAFPDEYVQFMLEQNGGYPEVCEFRFPDGSNSSLVNHFYSIGDMSANLYRRNRFQDYTDSFITIADDPGGNQILLKVKGENIGKIYFWDHEIDPDEENNMHFLANSLSEFLNMLK